jgi:hypothetical protein
MPRPWGVSGVLLVVLMTIIVAMLRVGWQGLLALLLIAATAAVAMVLWAMGDGQGDVLPLPEVDLNRLPQMHLAFFLGVSIFGFALCPYLDLTFNRARSALPRWPARWAFMLGFGVFFLGMILVTLAYSGLFLGRRWAWPQVVALHIFVQSAFTMGVHLRALGASMLPSALRGGAVVFAVATALAVFVGSLFLAREFEPMTSLHLLHDPGGRGMGAGEVIYRVFMGFYGLVFPAYVWLCVIPGGPVTRHRLRVWAFAVGVAAPMFWMAFIVQQTWWIGPALVVVLGARVFVPRAEGQGV